MFRRKARLAKLNCITSVERKLTSGNMTEAQQGLYIMVGRDLKPAVADCPNAVSFTEQLNSVADRFNSRTPLNTWTSIRPCPSTPRAVHHQFVTSILRAIPNEGRWPTKAQGQGTQRVSHLARWGSHQQTANSLLQTLGDSCLEEVSCRVRDTCPPSITPVPAARFPGSPGEAGRGL